jgi:hypothetical protein
LTVRLGSIATTTHWAPNRFDAAEMNCGSRTAAEFMPTLSAPALSRLRKSWIVLIPPPTVSGM